MAEVEAVIGEEGYAVVPLLDDAALAAVRSFYADLQLEGVRDNYCSIHEPDTTLKQRISAGIVDAVAAPLAALGLHGYEVMGGAFVTKGPTEAFVEAHQDPTFVDESAYTSLNVWVPLQDVDADNGCIWVLPHSHIDGTPVRPGNNWMYPSYYERIPKDRLWAAMTPVEMKAGEALVYDHRLLHGSKGNYTSNDRVALVSAMCPLGVDRVFYFAEADADRHYLTKFQMSPEDYLTFVQFVPQTGDLLERVETSPGWIDVEVFAARYEPAPVA